WSSRLIQFVPSLIIMQRLNSFCNRLPDFDPIRLPHSFLRWSRGTSYCHSQTRAVDCYCYPTGNHSHIELRRGEVADRRTEQPETEQNAVPEFLRTTQCPTMLRGKNHEHQQSEKTV